MKSEMDKSENNIIFNYLVKCITCYMETVEKIVKYIN